MSASHEIRAEIHAVHDVREVDWPRLPWRRIRAIREYASQLVLPGVEGLDKVPKTRFGLEQLARARALHDVQVQIEERTNELTQNGLSERDAESMALHELFMPADPTEPTLFDKE